MPRGPDFAFSGWSSQAFVGPDVPSALTSEIRALVRANGRRSADEFPLSSFREVFAGDVPGTVAAIWATIMWCAYAPAFDGNEQLLSVFGEYLGRPLPGDEWVRWLPSPPLTALVTLYGERVRAGAPRAALRLAALMADTAGILAADARFAPRAQALIAMLEPILRNPGLDHQTATGPLPAYRPPLAPQPRGTGPLTPPPVHWDTTFPPPTVAESTTGHGHETSGWAPAGYSGETSGRSPHHPGETSGQSPHHPGETTGWAPTGHSGETSGWSPGHSGEATGRAGAARSRAVPEWTPSTDPREVARAGRRRRRAALDLAGQGARPPGAGRPGGDRPRRAPSPHGRRPPGGSGLLPRPAQDGRRPARGRPRRHARGPAHRGGLAGPPPAPRRPHAARHPARRHHRARRVRGGAALARRRAAHQRGSCRGAGRRLRLRAGVVPARRRVRAGRRLSRSGRDRSQAHP
ncbi:hypothetical protein [Nonomuraea dietziae]|uniref:hypothetical protein n=1 Tax=Nonomuraea dietziae TaxID=65515 RepID=UPI0031DC8359